MRLCALSQCVFGTLSVHAREELRYIGIKDIRESISFKRL